eukprot:3625774-Amphidinium_carterae.2
MSLRDGNGLMLLSELGRCVNPTPDVEESATVLEAMQPMGARAAAHGFAKSQSTSLLGAGGSGLSITSATALSSFDGSLCLDDPGRGFGIMCPPAPLSPSVTICPSERAIAASAPPRARQWHESLMSQEQVYISA